MDDYTGLGATAWELLSGEEPGADYRYFQQVIERHPLPALDLGCGTGRLLLPFLSVGIEVEGVDQSADMLEICRRRATQRSIIPSLYQQTMQALDLPKRYGTIFLARGTFQLITDRAAVSETLRRCYIHLVTGGAVVITVFNRWEHLAREKLGEWVFLGNGKLPDGSELFKHSRTETRDLVEQSLTMTIRYRLMRDNQLLQEQLSNVGERWYYKHELELMMEKAGFRDILAMGNYTNAAFKEEHYVMTIVGIK